MGCGKSAASDDMDRYESLCKKHGMEPKITGLYTYDTEHERYLEDLEQGLSTVQAAENASARKVVEAQRKIRQLEEERERISYQIEGLKKEIEQEI